jgi:hypothetical protein
LARAPRAAPPYVDAGGFGTARRDGEGGVRMLGIERFLANGERALQERLGIRVDAAGLTDGR